MNTLDCPTISEATLCRMSTKSLTVLARWARARYYQLPIIPTDWWYTENVVIWRDVVIANENWRFLTDRCQRALTQRGEW